MPKAFTEKGLYMLATILKSKKAVETTFAIIETFSKIRQLSKAIKDLSKIKEEEDKKPLSSFLNSVNPVNPVKKVLVSNQ